MPVMLDRDPIITQHDGDSGSAPPSEKKMAFLVHLKVNDLTVTVYTCSEFEQKEEDTDKMATDPEDSDDDRSDEISDGGNEFMPHSSSEVQVSRSESLNQSNTLTRAPTHKIEQVGGAFAEEPDKMSAEEVEFQDKPAV